jgi:hypothetical protein
MAKFKLHDDGTLVKSVRGVSARKARYEVVQRAMGEIEATLWELIEDIQYIDEQCRLDGTDGIDDDDDEVNYEDLADDE